MWQAARLWRPCRVRSWTRSSAFELRVPLEGRASAWEAIRKIATFMGPERRDRRTWTRCQRGRRTTTMTTSLGDPIPSMPSQHLNICCTSSPMTRMIHLQSVWRSANWRRVSLTIITAAFIGMQGLRANMIRSLQRARVRKDTVMPCAGLISSVRSSVFARLLRKKVRSPSLMILLSGVVRVGTRHRRTSPRKKSVLDGIKHP